MSNIIETLRNYFTCELLPDHLSSEVALHFNVKKKKQSDNRALLFLDNNGLSWTVFALDKVTAVPIRRNGNFQTPISVPAVRPKRRHTLSNPAHRQDYMVACLNYTLQMMMPLPGWPVMAPNAYDNNNNRPFWRWCSTKSRAVSASSQGSWPALPPVCISLLITRKKQMTFFNYLQMHAP